MKKIIAALLCVSSIFALCACGKAENKLGSLSVSEYDDASLNTLVQLFIPQRTVTEETQELALTLENLTDMDFTFDAAQHLEIYDGEQWRVIPDKQDAVALVIYTLPANGTENAMFYISGHYDALSEGRYRIVLPLVAADGTQAVASAEFGIGRAEK